MSQSSTKKSLFVVGDSISIHYGEFLDPLCSQWFEYSRKGSASDIEQALAQIDVANSANGGDSSVVLSYLQRLEAEGSHTWDVLLLQCGLHDIKVVKEGGAAAVRQVPLDNYQANLKAILVIAARLAKQVVWARTTPVDDERCMARTVEFTRYNSDVVAYNEMADGIMAEAGMPSIDLYTLAQTFLSEDWTYDGVHFNKPFCRRQADFIAGVLTQFR